MMQLRPYQSRSVDAVYEHLRTRDDNPCVVIPTAGGKTPVMATICKDAVVRWNGRVLILAHVKELLEQTADKLRAVCPEVLFGIYSAGLPGYVRLLPVTDSPLVTIQAHQITGASTSRGQLQTRIVARYDSALDAADIA